MGQIGKPVGDWPQWTGQPNPAPSPPSRSPAHAMSSTIAFIGVQAKAPWGHALPEQEGPTAPGQKQHGLPEISAAHDVTDRARADRLARLTQAQLTQARLPLATDDVIVVEGEHTCLIAVLEKEPEAGDARARRQDLVHALTEDGAFLPARPGARFSDIASASRWLHTHEHQLGAQLALVAGCVQWCVHIALPYVSGMDRRALDARLTTSHAQLTTALLALFKADQTRQLARREDVCWQWDVLVDRSDQRSFDASLASALAALDLPEAACIRVTGPWPAYSFAALPPTPDCLAPTTPEPGYRAAHQTRTLERTVAGTVAEHPRSANAFGKNHCQSV